MRTLPGKRVLEWIRCHIWKVFVGIWISIVLAVGINIGSSWLITKHKLWDVSDTPLAWLLDHLVITFFAGGLLLLLTILAYLISIQASKQTKNQETALPGSLLAPAQSHRKRMREQLSQWYQDFLNTSIDRINWLDLDLIEKPEALYTPRELTMPVVPSSERTLSSGASIIQKYEDAHGHLLILGEPGSGKSTHLHLLAQHLLTQTETDAQAPLPFIFALSSWAQRCLPLKQWMTDYLVQIYKVSSQVAQLWIHEQQIIPLLDGLDEMEMEKQPLCIAAINRYHIEHPHALVVCSRSTEYDVASQGETLVLQRAVIVQPLTAIQIATRLLRGGEKLAGLYAAYQNNPALQKLAKTPLLLKLLIITYQGTTIHMLSSEEERLQQQVFTQFVKYMVKHKGNQSRYPLSETTVWLTFLARQMQARKQTMFALELLRASWLPKRVQWCYYLSLGLPYELLFLPAVGSLVFSSAFKGLNIEEIFLIIFSLILAPLMISMSVWNIDQGRGEPGVLEERRIREDQYLEDAQHDKQIQRWEHNEWLFYLRNTVFIGLLIGSPFAVLGGLIGWLSDGWVRGPLIGGSIGLGLAWMLRYFFQYFTLRFWFWRAGLFPLLAIPFLEDARARYLLMRVGNTYQFMHGLLLDFLAKSGPLRDDN